MKIFVNWRLTHTFTPWLTSKVTFLSQLFYSLFPNNFPICCRNMKSASNTACYALLKRKRYNTKASRTAMFEAEPTRTQTPQSHWKAEKTPPPRSHLPFPSPPTSQCVATRWYSFPFCRTKPTRLSAASSANVGCNLLFCRQLCAERSQYQAVAHA